MLRVEIRVQGQTVGTFCIYYMEDRPGEGDGPFLKEEVRLLSTIADRLSHFILFHKLKALRQTFDEAESVRKRDRMSGWRQSLQLLRVSDKGLFLRISRKMLNHLYSLGIEEAKVLMRKITKNGPLALRMALESIYNAVDTATNEALAFESSLFGLLASTEDMKEGMGAFLEKRKADFKGR